MQEIVWLREPWYLDIVLSIPFLVFFLFSARCHNYPLGLLLLWMQINPISFELLLL
jgi:hypothetical protein